MTGASNSNQQLNQPFGCSICGKSFQSYQALGGHKASHRRPPPDMDLTQLQRGRAKNELVVDADGRKKHRCSVCRKVFQTGQALGGHKRCHYWDRHWEGSLWKMRDFDLNLPPPVREMEDELRGGKRPCVACSLLGFSSI